MPEQRARDPERGPLVVGMEGIDVSPVALVDQSAFIRTARLGLPGNVVRQAVGLLGHRELFVQLLGTTAGNLNRYYRRKTLGQAQSEALLDTLRLVSQAAATFGDLERASEWLDTALPGLGGQRPFDLCDTFEGRGIVRNAIRRIEYGEFP
ncbi:MAG: DUF2384 domain-containing protein [Gammaproteobacteria bacterium]|nr:DUF2384 domain-containing protein [Gammaproteobacteria bacterium]